MHTRAGRKRLGLGLLGVAAAVAAVGAGAAPASLRARDPAPNPRHAMGHPPPAGRAMCSEVVFEGQVQAGESFAKVFAPGLEFYLEALASGWIVRVLPVGMPRGEHDDAELATPPYRSVNPLLISTDFAFRAQDAIAWNPRRFRYAENALAFRELAGLYPAVMANQLAAEARVAALVSRQPAGELQILNATLTPGTADQWRMAAAVASHLESTPHQVVQTPVQSPLGKLQALHFRVRLELPRGAGPAAGLEAAKIPCGAQPTP